MKILLNAQMRRIDRAACEKVGMPSIVLMENAARGAAAFFAAEFPLPGYRHCLVLAGKGNNGGDGLAIGRLLQQQGYSVRFLLLAPAAQLSPDGKTNFAIVRNLGYPWEEIKAVARLKKILGACRPGGTFLVDAVFGTGLSRPLAPGFFAEAIQAVNRSGLAVTAVDIPSGLGEGFLPAAGVHVRARATAALHSLKWAHFNPDGNDSCGKIRVVDIGIPRELADQPEHDTCLIEPRDFSFLLAARPPAAHKGAFGHALVVAGSKDKPGAGILSSFAALKAGAGLVTAAVAPENRLLFVKTHPEVMTMPYERGEEPADRCNDFSCVLAGPGLGDTTGTMRTVSLLLKLAKVPLILDADALNVLSSRCELLRHRRSRPLVLTPHPGEFSRLLGLGMKAIMADRLSLARAFAMEHRLHLVLKGHHTLLATPQGRVWVNQTGNAGMATAGSGDVLAGMIAGLTAQFHPQHPLETILAAAVFLHGYAGDLAAAACGQMSLTAGDILNHLPSAINKIDEFHSPFLGS
jgi:hydroxyethylthiazole kinase-like uncharacterized protein yjeF